MHFEGVDPNTRRMPLLLIVGVLLVAVGATVLLLRYDLYSVQTTVMAPALSRGDRLLIAALDDGEMPEPGDVVVIESGAWSDEPPGVQYILRVGGRGGDRVSCCDAQGRIQVNGKVDEPGSVSGTAPGAPTFSVTVPDGHLFLLGDRRDAARDSRVHLSSAQGSVPLSAVRGRVVAKLIPPGSVEGTHPISANPLSPFGTWVYAAAALLAGVLCLLLLVGKVGQALSRRRRGASALSPEL